MKYHEISLSNELPGPSAHQSIFHAKCFIAEKLVQHKVIIYPKLDYATGRLGSGVNENNTETGKRLRGEIYPHLVSTRDTKQNSLLPLVNITFSSFLRMTNILQDP